MTDDHSRDPLFGLAERLDAEAKGIIRILPLLWQRITLALGGGFWPGTLNLFVGDPGSAKTLIVLMLLAWLQSQGRRWVYWGFERDLVFTARRLLAIMAKDWGILAPENAKRSLELLQIGEYADLLADMTANLEPNTDRSAAYVLRRIEEICQTRELIVLDPIGMIDLDDFGHDPWEAQKKFTKEMLGIVAASQSRLLAVHHTRKTAPGASRQAGLSESAGSKALTDFADSVIFLEHHHDGLESDVKTADGLTRPITHKRTLFLAKTRDGRGTGWRIACDLSENAPELIEHGFIQKTAALRGGRK